MWILHNISKLASINLAEYFGIFYLNPARRTTPPNEEFVPYNNLDKGVFNNFNSWLYHIKRKSIKEYNEFVEEFLSVFPEIEHYDISFDQDKGRIRVNLVEKGIQISSNEMGSGWHSALVLFSFLMSPIFQVIIIDEPCAHMHASLARSTYRYFNRISSRKQIILASHNSALINSLNPDSVYFLTNKDEKTLINKKDSIEELLQEFKKIGIITPKEMYPVIKEYSPRAQKIYEYRKKIDDDEEEPAFQSFFKENPNFLVADQIRSVSKPKFGSEFEPDFLMESSSSLHWIIEIEKPRKKIFRKDTQPRADFTQAETQIRDYMSWARRNIRYLRDKDPAHIDREWPHITAENMRGLLVIGKKSDLSEAQIAALHTLNHDRRFEIKTFDDILNENITRLGNWEKM